MVYILSILISLCSIIHKLFHISYWYTRFIILVSSFPLPLHPSLLSEDDDDLPQPGPCFFDCGQLCDTLPGTDQGPLSAGALVHTCQGCRQWWLLCILSVSLPVPGQVLRWGSWCPQPKTTMHSDCESARWVYHYFTVHVRLANWP